ncbi:methylmalonyl-CoA mutase family protein [Sciscionella sediminilitoris]|uniref:methylmalonyl-CoA mutase family protein n=1 Tax=Sciscionella sediminilitoris TaxID=1445613 RepID=UPI0004DED406|nr:methylmalonyl-CoA mutase family protein [Sciscionella sp. SE31]
MTTAPERLELAAEFEAATRAQWRELVAGVFAKQGRTAPDDPELALATTTDDDITIRPLYTAEDGSPGTGLPGLAPYVRGADPQGTAWQVRTKAEGSDPAAVNECLLDDLEHGAGAVWLAAGEHGVPADGLARALDGVLLDLAPVVLSPGERFRAPVDALLACYAAAGIPDSGVRAVLGIDPLSVTGQITEPEYLAALAKRYPNTQVITVNGALFHEAGGSDAQELGYSIAAGLAYLRALTEAGLDADTAAATLEFRYAASVDQFGTIAKLRAARRLWSRVCEVSGIKGVPQRQHAVGSSAMMTARDPWVNMLRSTIAAFAAGVAGADAVTVRPFDERIGAPDAFARRIARNTQSILLEESHLAGVIDPAGGSYAVERRTDELANRAWERFTGVEAQGGIVAALGSGSLARELGRTWSAHRERIAHRTDPITGVSEFPDLEERPLSRPAADSEPPGILPGVHYAAEYEALRDRADAAPERPRVFLATLGSLAAYTARAGFARNTYAAGGIASVEAGPSETVAEIVSAFTDSGCTCVCVCGTEEAYGEWLAELVPALRSAGARLTALAGKPREAGCDQYVYAGCDALAALGEILEVSA